MKNFVLRALLIFSMSVSTLLAGCGPDDAIVGTWKFTSGGEGTWTFNKDHSFLYTPPENKSSLSSLGLGFSASLEKGKSLKNDCPIQWSLDSNSKPMRLDLKPASGCGVEVIHMIAELQSQTAMRVGLNGYDVPAPPDFGSAALVATFAKQ